jgi:hypothetical protein
VPINVRCYSNSDIILRRSEVTLRASFYRKRLESAHLAIFVDVSDQFILRGAFGFLFCRGAAGLSGNRARHAGTREHFES